MDFCPKNKLAVGPKTHGEPVVVETGVDPVTLRFSGVCSAD